MIVILLLSLLHNLHVGSLLFNVGLRDIYTFAILLHNLHVGSLLYNVGLRDIYTFAIVISQLACWILAL